MDNELKIDYKIIRDNTKSGAHIVFGNSSKKHKIEDLRTLIEQREAIYDNLTLSISYSIPSTISSVEYKVLVKNDLEVFGEIEFVCLDLFHEELDVFELFDEKSGLLEIYYLLKEANIINKNEELIFNRESKYFVTVIERIQIKEKYRGLGIGKYALLILFQHINKEIGEFICLKSYPLQHENKTKLDNVKNKKQRLIDQDKLDSFYVNLGMIKFKSKNGCLFYKG